MNVFKSRFLYDGFLVQGALVFLVLASCSSNSNVSTKPPEESADKTGLGKLITLPNMGLISVRWSTSRSGTPTDINIGPSDWSLSATLKYEKKFYNIIKNNSMDVKQFYLSPLLNGVISFDDVQNEIVLALHTL